MSGLSHAAYMASDGWKKRREAHFRRAANHRCKKCGTRSALDVHHRTYERMGNEAARDLVSLCRHCHTNLHRMQRSRKMTVEDATEVFLSSVRVPTRRKRKKPPQPVRPGKQAMRPKQKKRRARVRAAMR